jgi:hypothetical protein
LESVEPLRELAIEKERRLGRAVRVFEQVAEILDLDRDPVSQLQEPLASGFRRGIRWTEITAVSLGTTQAANAE